MGRERFGSGEGVELYPVWIDDVNKNERNKASAFSTARRRFRSEKVELDWRLAISVNLGWRQVPGEGG